MKLVVTGGAGFLGSCFIRHWRAQHPNDVLVNLDRLTYAGSEARVAEVSGSPGYQFIRGDICDPAVVARALEGGEALVHFAAETHVDRSIVDAAPFLRTNVDGTVRVLEEARRAGLKRIIHISTDEVYGPVLEGVVDETAPLSPRSPYAASKAAGDLFAQAFQKTYGAPVIIVRPTNVYGPWQFPEKFIPVCITQAIEGRRIPIYGDGRQRRAWLFVADLCDALQVIVGRGAVGAIYNVAGGEERTNLETAAAVLGCLGRGQELLDHVADRPGHDRRYAMRDEPLRALGWSPRMSFESGVRETVTWYDRHQAWWRPLVDQLREHSGHWLNRPVGARASASPGVPR